MSALALESSADPQEHCVLVVLVTPVPSLDLRTVRSALAAATLCAAVACGGAPSAVPAATTSTVNVTVTSTPAAVTVTDTPAAVTVNATVTQTVVETSVQQVLTTVTEQPAVVAAADVDGGDSADPAVVVPVQPAAAEVPAAADTSEYYANCSEAKAAGAAPLFAGDPGYRAALDRDKDGVACES